VAILVEEWVVVAIIIQTTIKAEMALFMEPAVEVLRFHLSTQIVSGEMDFREL
jgi:hypothetical protein